MKKHILTLIVTIGTVIGGFSQNFTLPNAPSLFGEHNQVGSISFDLNGVALGKGKNYFNTLGKPTQSLSWDVLTGKIWASESLYDRHGRPSLQTLSASIGTDLLISNDFILDQGGNTYTYNDFDTGATIENPNPVSNQSELGTYYSPQNTTNPYQDITEYPFVRTVYSKLNPGNGHKTLGGNKIDSEWKQSYSFSMPAGSEIDIYLNNGVPLDSKVIKTVSRDVNKTDVVVFTDSDGNTLLAARSGPHIYYHEYNNVLEIGRQGFVDIHIPERQQGVNTEFDIVNPDTLLSGPLKVYDLITEELVATISSSTATQNVPSGFYRIAVSNPLLYKDYISPISISHVVNYYDASKNEYDKADRLVSSMQPIGGTSTFTYNSLGQLLETTSPDEGTAKFLYRKDGQIRFSQNIKQQNAGEFSYTNYDDLGRPIESGVAVEKSGLTNFDQLEPYVDNNSILDNHDKKEVHKTIYDIAVFGNAVLTGDLCGLPIQDYKQTFVAGNVSNTSTEFPVTSTTWYSYDVQGRVQWMIQKIAGLECYKTLNYKYDPATGQVIEVDYQRHDADERFIHRYEYNTAGQLEKVYTSRTGLDNSWEEQANYFYTESGELVRTVLAENLQGIDYVYNLNGQLKAINHPSLAASNDPGQDGALGSLIPADVFGFSIDYYDGDYTRTGTPTPIAQENTNGVDQYNGNIKGVGFSTKVNSSSQGTLSPNFRSYMYEYNKNNWLQKATYGTGSISSTGSGSYKTNFTPNIDNDYEVSNLQYDPNGNITSLKRNGYTDSNGTNDMDQFTYSYNGNKLLNIQDDNDNPDSDRYNDLKNQVNNGNDNYTYNEIGQLVSDISGKAFYEYNASGLVTRIKTFGDNGSAQDEQYLFDDYTNAVQNALYPWSLSGGIKSVNYAGTYIPNTGDPSCIALDNQYGKSISFELPDEATATGAFDVIPNVPNTFELDLIVDQWDGSQAAAGYYIYIFDANSSIGTINPTPIAELSYNENLDYIGSGIDSCSKFYDRHESLTFTPSSSKIRIQIKKITVGGSEPIYIDNISLAAGTVPILDITYNDRGHRVRKTTYSLAGGDTRQTYYVRDASGTAIAIYSKMLSTQKPANESKLDELPVYGASRLGVYTLNYGLSDPQGDPIDGFYRYELTDHLGNVRAVIGKATDDTPYVVAKTDYYPFGMPMPNQTIEGNYRYAYQGQEKDPETGMEAFELRLWDARIGRWLTTDPYSQYHSPYLGMGNNPISFRDPDGGFACDDCPEGTFADGAEHIGADGGTYVYDAELGRWSDSSAVIFNISPNQTKTQNAGIAFALVSSGTRINGMAAAVDGPLPIGDTAGAISQGLVLSVAAYYTISNVFEDDYTVTSTDNSELYLTLYRGVHSGHPAHPLAMNGIATPWALGPVGHNNPTKHNSESPGNNESIFTSWTVDAEVANYHANKHGPGGLILTKRFRIYQVVPSPDAFLEGEWLVPGVVTGAGVSLPTGPGRPSILGH